MKLFKRFADYWRKHVYNPHYIKRLFKKNHSRIKKTALITNPDCIVCGKGVRILYGARIECFKKYANKQLMPSLLLENNVCIGPNFTALISNKCVIGEDTIIAHNVTIVTGNHGMDLESDIPFQLQELQTKEIYIGKNCWLGCNVVFLGGSSVGNNCIVAAGSVVNKQFPDNVLIAGVPAKIIKKYDLKQNKWVKFSSEFGRNN